MAANEANTIVQIKTYIGKISGEPNVNNEVEEQRWFSRNDDFNILSPIIKNKILPVLLEKNII